MKPPKTPKEVVARHKRVARSYNRQHEMVKLSRDMYEMRKDRTSAFNGRGSNNWRTRVPVEYWESSNRPQNAVDVMTAVLSGHKPQYFVTVPGDYIGDAASRAEKFLAGVWRTNSRRAMVDLEQYANFRTILDGRVGIRIYWDYSDVGPDAQETVEDPNGGPPRLVHIYKQDNFPIVLDVVEVDKLFPMGKGVNGKPFDELVHIESKTPAEVMYDWEDSTDKGVSADWIKTEYKEQDAMHETCKDYIEWWGEEPSGQVWHAVVFDGKWVRKPTEINYPCIPYVLTAFKLFDADRMKDKSLEYMPFLYPMFQATDREEYLTSRALRLIDMYANLPPVHYGDTPVHIEGTWGDVVNLQKGEKLEFPQWPGNSPDLYKYLEDVRNRQSEASFSPTMFGNLSSRMSGYGISQLVGADTIRTDIPRVNLELAYGRVADIIFALMDRFSPNIHLSVVAQVKNKNMATILSGEETRALLVEVFIKPKQTADEVRLAALGAQLASLPKPIVSNSFILEKYFGIQQPDEEIERRMVEEAANDPIIRLTTMLEVLLAQGHFGAAIVQKQLEQLVQAQMGQQGAMPPAGGAPIPEAFPGANQPGPVGAGEGITQTTFGNPPQPGATGNPSAPGLFGGPQEGF